MKNYLRFKILFTLAIIILFSLNLAPKIYAESHNIFKNKLDEWGYNPLFFDICIPNRPATCIDAGPSVNISATTQNSSATYFVKTYSTSVDQTPENTALIILSSYAQAANFNPSVIIGKYNSIFYVCDTPAEFNDQIECTSNSISSQTGEYVSLGPDDYGTQLRFAHIRSNGKEFYVIPENLFTISAYNSRLNEYFKSNVTNQPQESQATDSTSALSFTIIDELKEISIYIYLSIFSLLTLFLFHRPGSNIRDNKHFWLKLKDFTSNAIRKYQAFAINFALLILVFFVSLALSLLFVSPNRINLHKILNIFNNLGKFNFLDTSLWQINLSDLITIFAINFITLLVLSILLPYIFEFILEYISLLKKTNINIKNKFIKYIPIILINFALLFAFLDNYILVSILVLAFIFILLKAHQQGFSFNSTYTNHDRILFTAIFIALSFIGIPYLQYIKHAPVAAVNEDLLDSNKNIIRLPYIKDFKDPVLFKDHIFTPAANIFVDDYLVFSPIFPQINNRRVEEFSPENNFILLEDAIESPEHYLTNGHLREEIISDMPTKAIYIEDNNEINHMQISFECSLDTKKEDMRIKYTSKDESLNNLVFEFPLCKKTQNSYLIPLFGFYYSPAILTIDMSDALEIRELSLYNNTSEADYRFLKTFEAYTSPELDLNQNAIYSYSSNQENYDIMNDLGRPFNISSIINDLKNKGLIPNPFVIWSDQQSVLIKNNYE